MCHAIYSLELHDDVRHIGLVSIFIHNHNHGLYIDVMDAHGRRSNIAEGVATLGRQNVWIHLEKKVAGCTFVCADGEGRGGASVKRTPSCSGQDVELFILDFFFYAWPTFLMQVARGHQARTRYETVLATEEGK